MPELVVDNIRIKQKKYKESPKSIYFIFLISGILKMKNYVPSRLQRN